MVMSSQKSGMAAQVWDTSGNTMSKPTSLLFNPFFSTDEAGPCTLRPTDPLLCLSVSPSLFVSLSLSPSPSLSLALSLSLSLSLSLYIYIDLFIYL